MESKDAAQTPGGNDEPRDLKIDSNQVNVTIRRSDAFYVHIGKKTLETFDTVELHALGNAISTSVMAAEKLVRNGYADYISLETKTIDVEETRTRRKGDNSHPARMVKRPKMLITLKRSKDFNKNMEKFKAIKEENDRYIQTERAQREKK